MIRGCHMLNPKFDRKNSTMKKVVIHSFLWIWVLATLAPYRGEARVLLEREDPLDTSVLRWQLNSEGIYLDSLELIKLEDLMAYEDELELIKKKRDRLENLIPELTQEYEKTIRTQKSLHKNTVEQLFSSKSSNEITRDTYEKTRSDVRDLARLLDESKRKLRAVNEQIPAVIGKLRDLDTELKPKLKNMSAQGYMSLIKSFEKKRKTGQQFEGPICISCTQKSATEEEINKIQEIARMMKYADSRIQASDSRHGVDNRYDEESDVDKDDTQEEERPQVNLSSAEKTMTLNHYGVIADELSFKNSNQDKTRMELEGAHDILKEYGRYLFDIDGPLNNNHLSSIAAGLSKIEKNLVQSGKNLSRLDNQKLAHYIKYDINDLKKNMIAYRNRLNAPIAALGALAIPMPPPMQPNPRSPHAEASKVEKVEEGNSATASTPSGAVIQELKNRQDHKFDVLPDSVEPKDRLSNDSTVLEAARDFKELYESIDKNKQIKGDELKAMREKNNREGERFNSLIKKPPLSLDPRMNEILDKLKGGSQLSIGIDSELSVPSVSPEGKAQGLIALSRLNSARIDALAAIHAIDELERIKADPAATQEAKNAASEKVNKAIQIMKLGVQAAESYLEAAKIHNEINMGTKNKSDAEVADHLAKEADSHYYLSPYFKHGGPNFPLASPVSIHSSQLISGDQQNQNSYSDKNGKLISEMAEKIKVLNKKKKDLEQVNDEKASPDDLLQKKRQREKENQLAAELKNLAARSIKQFSKLNRSKTNANLSALDSVLHKYDEFMKKNQDELSISNLKKIDWQLRAYKRNLENINKNYMLYNSNTKRHFLEVSDYLNRLLAELNKKLPK